MNGENVRKCAQRRIRDAKSEISESWPLAVMGFMPLLVSLFCLIKFGVKCNVVCLALTFGVTAGIAGVFVVIEIAGAVKKIREAREVLRKLNA